MKQLMFFAAVAAAACVVSCAEPTEEMMRAALGGVVRVSFADKTAGSASRGFFDEIATTAPWEEALSSLTICVFYLDGRPIVQRTFSAEELARKSASFALPEVADGAVCEFYAAANLAVPPSIDRGGLLALVESDAGAYNGPFAQASGSAVRAAGFAMSGSASAAVSASAPTDVVLVLSRTAAKVAIEATPSAAFGRLYPGALRVDRAVVRRASSRSALFAAAGANPGAPDFSYAQPSFAAADGGYRNLFYLFESGAAASGSRVELLIEATYDADGNWATAADQLAMRYPIELQGEGDGALARNGFYRVAATIDGLEGSDATVGFSVAPWRTPATQWVSVGL